jgi:NAD(P)-dependent dehydrogenase (short-subunit alcohol dehydrogenase family)
VKILLVGASGTIGTAVAHALENRHEVLCASHTRSALRVDIADPASIRQLYAKVGKLDAVVSTAGRAALGALLSLTDEDFALGLSNKLMGQVNLVRLGMEHIASGGSFTLTSGIASRRPMANAAVISLVNAGLEGFVRTAALDLPRGVRVNAVAPGWVRETLEAMNADPSSGLPAAEVAQSYVKAVEGAMSGQVFDAVAGAG